jgi:hypothetical protein
VTQAGAAAAIRITRAGMAIDASEAGIGALRAEFDRRHCIVLPQLIEPRLLSLLHTRLETATFVEKTNRKVGDELRLQSGAVTAALEFLTNDSRLFALIQQMTGCSPIGCFRARVYRHVADQGHSSDWHEDLVEGRMLTMSLNLGATAYDGGRLQIRDVNTHQVYADVANTGPGDALIFRIDRSLQHRVTPTIGDVPRTAYAGWFLQQPDFATELRRRLNGAAHSRV